MAHYWAHHTQYMDWIREQGWGSWTGDVSVLSGGSGGERQRRRGAERERNDEGLNEKGRSNESDECAKNEYGQPGDVEDLSWDAIT